MEKALAAILAESALSVVLTAQGQGANDPCNRDCLVSAAEQYLDSLIGDGLCWEDGMSDRIQWQGK